MFEYKFLVLDCFVTPEKHSENLSQMGKDGWVLFAVLPGINEEAECTIGSFIFSRFVPLELPTIPPIEEIISASQDTPSEVQAPELAVTPATTPEDPLTAQRKQELRVYWERLMSVLSPKEIADLLEATQRAEWEQLIREITPRLTAKNGEPGYLPYFNLHGLRQIYREVLALDTPAAPAAA